jgi:hypothetical protein
MLHRSVSPQPAKVSTRQARACAVGVIIQVATLPLLWQTLASTPFGALRVFHLGALGMLVVARPGWAAVREVARSLRPLILVLVLFTIAMTATAIAYADTPADSAQNLVYALVAIYAGGCFLTACRRPEGRRLLVWVCPVALVVWIVVFGRALLSAGVDPIAAYRAAFAGQRDVVLHDVFRGAFSAGSSQDVVSNYRHEMYGALLSAANISALVVRERKLLARCFIAVCWLVTLALLLTSLSRAVLVALAAMLLLAAARPFLRSYVSFPALIVGMLAVMAAPFAVKPFTEIVLNRFLYDTQSYQGRAGAWDAFAGPDMWQRLLLGGGGLSTSTHTLVGDALLKGSLLAGILGTVVVAILLKTYLRAAGAWLRTGHLEPLAAAGLLGLGLVRCFTSGGGLLHLAVWTAITVGAAWVTAQDTSPDGNLMHSDVVALGDLGDTAVLDDTHRFPDPAAHQASP